MGVASASGRVLPVRPYSTYIPVYGGEGGRTVSSQSSFNLIDNFILCIIEQPYIALCSFAILLWMKLSINEDALSNWVLFKVWVREG